LPQLVVILPLVLCRLLSGGASIFPPLVALPHLIVFLFFSGALASCQPRLFVVLPLVMLLPPVRLCLRLSLHHRLSLHPSCISCPAGCHVASQFDCSARLPNSSTQQSNSNDVGNRNSNNMVGNKGGNGKGGKGNGDGNKGGGQATATTWAIAMAMRVAGNKEDDGESGKGGGGDNKEGHGDGNKMGNGDGNEDGGQQRGRW
jgi:hypothetical protein